MLIASLLLLHYDLVIIISTAVDNYGAWKFDICAQIYRKFCNAFITHMLSNINRIKYRFKFSRKYYFGK